MRWRSCQLWTWEAKRYKDTKANQWESAPTKSPCWIQSCKKNTISHSKKRCQKSPIGCRFWTAPEPAENAPANRQSVGVEPNRASLASICRDGLKSACTPRCHRSVLGSQTLATLLQQCKSEWKLWNKPTQKSKILYQRVSHKSGQTKRIAALYKWFPQSWWRLKSSGWPCKACKPPKALPIYGISELYLGSNFGIMYISNSPKPMCWAVYIYSTLRQYTQEKSGHITDTRHIMYKCL